MSIFTDRIRPSFARATRLVLLICATGVLTVFLPSSQASAAVTFDPDYIYLTQGSPETATTLAVTDPIFGTDISGFHEVTASLAMPANGEVDEVIVYGDGGTPITIQAGQPAQTIFASYNFNASGSTLSVDIEPVAGKYGTGTLTFTVEVNTGTSGDLGIDTRLSEGENFDTHRYAEDPMGGLIDMNPTGSAGVYVNDDRMVGLIWSESFGWIDLQPPGGGITLDIVSLTRANLVGNAWNEDIGWISFGEINGTGGVFIDDQGYLHGTAWNDNYGTFSFGDYMALNPSQTINNDAVTGAVFKSTNWAKTSWTFPPNDPPTITLTGPADNSSSTDRNTLFEFDIADPNADIGYGNLVGYTLNLRKKNGSGVYVPYRSVTEPATHATTIAGSSFSYTFPTILDPGEYRWQMWAFDNMNEWSAASTMWDFTVESSYPITNLIYPINGETVTAAPKRRPTFEFTIEEPDLNNTIRYTVQISTASDFSSILPQSSASSSWIDQGVTTPVTYYYTPPYNLPKGTLYWRVVAEDQFGNTQSPIPSEDFVIDNDPPVLQNVTLRNNANAIIPDGGTTTDTSPTLFWETTDTDGTDISTTIRVHLVSDDSIVWDNGGSPFDHQTGQQQRTFGLLTNDDYYYRIQSCDSDGDCTAWVQADFTVGISNRHGNVGTAAILSLKDPSAILEAAPQETDNNKFVWNPTVGWLDMNPIGGGVVVKNSNVQGYAWNDTLGWIRMNCEAFDADIGITDGSGDPIGSECSTINYGVQNSGGTLTGKALVESTGEFIYFDSASFVADGGTANPNITVSIGCDVDTDGHFFGRAWSDDIGWVSFGRQALMDEGMSDADSKDYFSMTEWSCSTNNAPELEDGNQYRVFSASNTDYSYPIARKNNAPFSADVVCDDNSGAQGTQIVIEKLAADGTLDYTLSDLSDFSISCVNADGDVDGKLWLTLDASGIHNVTSTPGIYRISGDVGDVSGNTTSFPIDASGPHDFEAEYIFQVVAGEPDMTHSDTVTTTKCEQGCSVSIPGGIDLVADGDDTIRYQLQLKDQFGNPVVRSYKFEDSTKQQLKAVSYRAVFWDDVEIDQVDRLPNPRQAVTVSSPYTDPFAPLYDQSHASIQIARDNVTDPTLQADFNSIAPTTAIDTLRLSRLEAKIEQLWSYPDGTRADVGQTDDPVSHPGGVKTESISGQFISFRPIMISAISNETSFMSATEGSEGTLDVAITNISNNIQIDDFDWMGYARSALAGGLPGSTTFTNTHLKRADGSLWSTPNNETSHIEVSATASNFDAGDPSQFPLTIASKIPTSGEPLEVMQKLFDSMGVTGSGNETASFKFATTPDNVSNSPEEYPEFSHYVAINYGTVTSPKIVKFRLQTTLSTTSIGSPTMSISGSGHGESFDPSVIVGEKDSVTEFAQIGAIYDRQETRQIIYENYNTIVGVREPEANAFAPQETEIFNTFADLQAIRTIDDTANSRSLQGGKVLWFERDPSSVSLSVVLGKEVGNGAGEWDPLTDYGSADSFRIVKNPGDEKDSVTLLIRGGNLYIRNNIYLTAGTNLGVIVMSSRENAEDGTEGNIFIHPEVTHIEGVFYADGSIMSAKDDNGNDRINEQEIMDGHHPDFTEYTNQLYIKGSVVSQNTVGKSGAPDYEIPPDVWMPTECPDETKMPCSGDVTRQMRTAQRYDFAFLRRYRLGNVYDEPDSDIDGIKDSQDCDVNPGICSDDGFGLYNPSCQTPDGSNAVPLPSACAPQIIGKSSSDSGRCAVGTSWCSTFEDDEPYDIDCSLSGLCDTNGELNNLKTGAAVIIEYDSRIKQITPVGMDIPSVVNIE